MKVLFIYPIGESLGIEYLSAVLKRRGHEAELIYDPRLFYEIGYHNKFLSRMTSSHNRLVKKAVNSDADLICFSVTSDIYNWACLFAKEIKEIISTPIIFGGIHPTSDPESVINMPFINMICMGEGEGAIVELVSGMKKKHKYRYREYLV